MQIELNGELYDVPASNRDMMINQLWGFLMREYENIPEGWRVSGMGLTRTLLYKMERDLIKTHGKEIALQVARPAKGADPNTHLLWVMTGAIREGLKNATFTIETDAQNARTVTAFNLSIPYPGAVGGQNTAGGNERVGENHRLKTPGQRHDSPVQDA